MDNESAPTDIGKNALKDLHFYASKVQLVQAVIGSEQAELAFGYKFLLDEEESVYCWGSKEEIDVFKNQMRSLKQQYVEAEMKIGEAKMKLAEWELKVTEAGIAMGEKKGAEEMKFSDEIKFAEAVRMISEVSEVQCEIQASLTSMQEAVEHTCELVHTLFEDGPLSPTSVIDMVHRDNVTECRYAAFIRNAVCFVIK